MTLLKLFRQQSAPLFALLAPFSILVPAPAFSSSDEDFQEALKKVPVIYLAYNNKGQDNKLIVNIDLDVPAVIELPFTIGRVDMKNAKHVLSGSVNNKPNRFWILGRQKGNITPALIFDQQGRQVITLETHTIIKNAAFIWACYLIVGLFIGALTLWIFRDERKQHQKIDALNKDRDRK